MKQKLSGKRTKRRLSEDSRLSGIRFARGTLSFQPPGEHHILFLPAYSLSTWITHWHCGSFARTSWVIFLRISSSLRG